MISNTSAGHSPDRKFGPSRDHRERAGRQVRLIACRSGRVLGVEQSVAWPPRLFLVQRLIPDVIEPNVDTRHQSGVGALIERDTVPKWRLAAPARLNGHGHAGD